MCASPRSRGIRDVGVAPAGVVMGESVRATYVVETALPLEKAAEVLAGEQSTGTFVRVERETDDLRARFAAQVESVQELPSDGASPLPGTIGEGARRRARLTLRFPLDNCGPRSASATPVRASARPEPVRSWAVPRGR